jgi:hypothetical protein
MKTPLLLCILDLSHLRRQPWRDTVLFLKRSHGHQPARNCRVVRRRFALKPQLT